MIVAVGVSAALALLLFGCGQEGGSPAPPSQPQSAVTASQPPAEEGAALYKQFCAPCHGAQGKGDGPAAAGLPVKPADHTNAQVMGKIADAELFKAIKEGGQAVGKSQAMPPWGGALRDEQIRSLVLYVRSLAKPR